MAQENKLTPLAPVYDKFVCWNHIFKVPTQYWKVLNFKIGFQDLEKVFNFATMYIMYWKSMEIWNYKEISSIWAEFYWRWKALHYFCSAVQCVKLSFMIKNFEKWREVMVLNLSNLVLKRYWKSMENDFLKCVGTLHIEHVLLWLFPHHLTTP